MRVGGVEEGVVGAVGGGDQREHQHGEHEQGEAEVSCQAERGLAEVFRPDHQVAAAAAEAGAGE